MATIEHQMTEIYSFLDDVLKANPSWAAWRHSNHSAPEFTDAEVITIALMQGCFGVATLKKTYELIADNHRSAFPRLPSYKQWIARLHLLSEVVGRLVSKHPPWSIEMSTSTDPGRISRSIRRVNSFGASAPGTRAAPITRSDSAARASTAVVVA